MGERGHQPSATVWSLATGAVVRELAGGHRFGIGCISFTPSGGGVVTMGFKHDRMLRVSVIGVFSWFLRRCGAIRRNASQSVVPACKGNTLVSYATRVARNRSFLKLGRGVD